MTTRPLPLLPACAAFALAAAACDSGPPRDPAGEGAVFVLTTDFETGAFSILDLPSEAAAVNVGLTHSDAAARVRGARVYVLNRLGQDNVTALDAADRFRVLWQRSTEPGSNPQDIAFAADDKAYVTRLDHRSVLILDPRDGSTRGEVDVSAYADADGSCEMSSALALDGRVVLAAERLDRDDLYRPAARGLLVVLDPATDAISGTIELTGENPYGDMAPAPGGRLLVAEVGRFGELDGGIEEVDVATLTAHGFRVTEETLGGDVSSFTVASDGSWWLVVSDPSAVTSVVRFDPDDDSRRTIVAGTGFTLSCAAEVEAGVLAVCDRTRTAPGIRLFGLDGAERTAAPIDVGLPPWQVRVLER